MNIMPNFHSFVGNNNLLYTVLKKEPVDNTYTNYNKKKVINHCGRYSIDFEV